MTLEELEAAAQGDGSIVLVLPVKSRGYSVRLFGSHGPRGEVINAKPEGTVARFSKASIRRAIQSLKETAATEDRDQPR